MVVNIFGQLCSKGSLSSLVMRPRSNTVDQVHPVDVYLSGTALIPVYTWTVQKVLRCPPRRISTLFSSADKCLQSLASLWSFISVSGSATVLSSHLKRPREEDEVGEENEDAVGAGGVGGDGGGGER
jgi:hypothetical protein